MQHRAVAQPGKQKVYENPFNLLASLEERGFPREEAVCLQDPSGSV